MNYSINYSIECLLGIERAILSSLISYNNVDKIEVCLKIIEANDFYYDQHGVIFETIIKLHKCNQIINEHTVFLENQTKINQQYYVDIIATTPLYTITDSVKKLKEYSLKRQITTVAAQIKEGDFSQIMKLQDLREKLDNLEHVIELKNIDDAREQIKNAIDFYNNERPHASINMMTPAEAQHCKGDIKRKWKNYYKKRNKESIVEE